MNKEEISRIFEEISRCAGVIEGKKPLCLVGGARHFKMVMIAKRHENGTNQYIVDIRINKIGSVIGQSSDCLGALNEAMVGLYRRAFAFGFPKSKNEEDDISMQPLVDVINNCFDLALGLKKNSEKRIVETRIDLDSRMGGAVLITLRGIDSISRPPMFRGREADFSFKANNLVDALEGAVSLANESTRFVS